MSALEKLAEVGEPLFADPRLAPVHKVGEIHIRRDVLAAGVFIHGGAFEPLLVQIAAGAAMGPTVVEVFRRRPVVDGEEASGLPVRQPIREETAVGIVDFDPLAERMVVEKTRRIGQRCRWEKRLVGLFPLVEMHR